jgi:hypothetical protein
MFILRDVDNEPSSQRCKTTAVPAGKPGTESSVEHILRLAATILLVPLLREED